ncbi:MAG: DUF2782 domain-containing protein [Gammaproteobacteria bacterium]|nr:DUF2782 domain-containing protein [Gammaproteobacteria bacterium]MCP5424638.1 DUF2782 domain-containing protein [Gammaproteobacteria bacterium]MCP5460039.1 DUF2782 domain-containing protein [Gammaproteobacteria bacterium]
MRLLLFLLLFVGSVAMAQPLPPNLEPVPDGSPGGTSPDENLDIPQVTIRRTEEGVIQEYRINDKLYMVKIVPHKGAPYFLVDTDGDGDLETRYNDLDDGLAVPAWVILSW